MIRSAARHLSLTPFLFAALLLPLDAIAQSEAASRQSEQSLDASLEVPLAVAGALSEGGKFSVTAVRDAGDSIAITLSATAAAASFAVKVSAETARALGIAIGTAVVVTAVSTGWILSIAGKALCYIANDKARAHIHSRRLGA